VEQVFVVKNDNTVQAVRIKSGLQDHLHIEITEGLTKEDRVVTGPYAAISKTLENGTKVTPTTKSSDESAAD
jgi:HlyD family secretion protein